MRAEPDVAAMSDAAAQSPARAFLYAFLRHKGAVVGLGVLVLVVLAAIFADVVAPHAPGQQFRDSVLQPPAWTARGSWTFPLGTDPIGRDILSRVIHGARFSLLIAIGVVALSLVAGITIGAIAGFAGGLVDLAAARLMDVLLALPGLLLAIIVVAILGPGMDNAVIAISIVFLPHIVRIARAAVLVELSKTYVAATRLAGAKPVFLLFDTILPNCMAPLLVQAALCFSGAILEAAALGFLGLGAQPPTPEWGTMLADSREFVLRAWWVVTFPGLAILIVVLALNVLGDGLRDALDPRLRRS
ncbi:MAG: ABC transporter permease subunit [Alphaproteobacteria bacterium]|nr:ABC transporter permease subunit [Alphaproteobacteria bacterium]